MTLAVKVALNPNTTNTTKLPDVLARAEGSRYLCDRIGTNNINDEMRAIRYDLVNRIRDEISKHDFPEIMKDYVKRIKYSLDDIDERIVKYGFDLSNGYPTVGEYIDGEERYYDEYAKGYDRLRKNTLPI